MKRIAVLVLCLMLLLSGCTVGAIAPGDAGVRIGLGGLRAALAGQTALDIAGLNAVAEVAENDAAIGMRLYVENEGQVYAELIVTAGADRVAIVANGQSSGSRVYTITDPDTVQAVAEAIDGLLAIDIANLSDEELEEFLAQAEEQLGSLEVTEEEMQESMEKAQRLADAMEKCFTEAGPMEIDGVTYEGRAIHATEAEIAELLWANDLAGAADSLENGGLGVDVTGGMYYSMEGGNYTDLTLHLDIPDQGVVGVHMTADESVAGVSAIDVAADADGEPVASVSLNLLDGGVAEAPWLDVDVSEATDLTGMTREEMENELVMVLGSLGGQAAAGYAIAAMNGEGLFD